MGPGDVEITTAPSFERPEGHRIAEADRGLRQQPVAGGMQEIEISWQRIGGGNDPGCLIEPQDRPNDRVGVVNRLAQIGGQILRRAGARAPDCAAPTAAPMAAIDMATIDMAAIDMAAPMRKWLRTMAPSPGKGAPPPASSGAAPMSVRTSAKAMLMSKPALPGVAPLPAPAPATSPATSPATTAPDA